MIYDIMISDQAETDLREIFEYIAFELQAQMAELFQSSRTNIVEHIRNIYEEGELDEDLTCRNFRQVRTEGIDGLPEKYLTTTKFLTSFLDPF